MFKFDGIYLKDDGKKIANVRGNKIWKDSGQCKCLANIRGKKIWKGASEGKCLANIRGKKIWKGAGQDKCLAKLSDIKKKIKGLGDETLVALWITCVR